MQTVPISSFSGVGQLIILILIQIGGLGLMTFSFFIASLFLNLGMTSKLMAGQLFEFESWSKIKAFLTIMIMVTLGLEAIGAGMLFSAVSSCQHIRQCFIQSFMRFQHFANAGISLFDNNMVTMSGNMYVLGTISGLVFAGGIGFIVWYEVADSLRHVYLWLRNRSCPLLLFHWHTKIALTTSMILITFGTIGIWGIERLHSLKHLKGFQALVNAFFLSISMRNAGFMVTDITTMAHATILYFTCINGYWRKPRINWFWY